MDVILISPKGRDGQMRDCLEWLGRLPNHRLRVVDEYVDGKGQHLCHVVVGDPAIAEMRPARAAASPS